MPARGSIANARALIAAALTWSAMLGSGVRGGQGFPATAPATAPDDRAPRLSGQRLIFLQDFEREGDWDGIWNDKLVPQFNRRCLEGTPDAKTGVCTLLIPTGHEPVAACTRTSLSFDCFVQDASSVTVRLAGPGGKGLAASEIRDPVQDRWTPVTLDLPGRPAMERGEKIASVLIDAHGRDGRPARLLVDNVRLFGDVHPGEPVGPALPLGPAERTVFLENFERPGCWEGTWNDRDAPQSNTHSLEGRAGNRYFAKAIRVGIRRPPLAMAAVTELSFDYYLEGADVLTVFLFNLDIRDNCRYRVDNAARGKWASMTMRVTSDRLKAGHRVDDIFFFAGKPGDEGVRLLVDNVRLDGRDD